MSGRERRESIAELRAAARELKRLAGSVDRAAWWLSESQGSVEDRRVFRRGMGALVRKLDAAVQVLREFV